MNKINWLVFSIFIEKNIGIEVKEEPHKSPSEGIIIGVKEKIEIVPEAKESLVKEIKKQDPGEIEEAIGEDFVENLGEEVEL